jgi:hypothetical protein
VKIIQGFAIRMTTTATSWKNDLLLAFCATLVVLAINAISGFPSLANYGGDNDSMLRLVEVRDLLGGQGWFDLHQYRMGPAGGFVMHWSRLVDTPIALIILAFHAMGASAATAERDHLAARSLWPDHIRHHARFAAFCRCKRGDARPGAFDRRTFLSRHFQPRHARPPQCPAAFDDGQLVALDGGSLPFSLAHARASRWPSGWRPPPMWPHSAPVPPLSSFSMKRSA